MIRLSNEVFKSELARQAILATIRAKGRKVKGLDEKIQNACNSLSEVAAHELFTLCRKIVFTYNYPKWRLKATHNQRNNKDEARAARVANFKENNPDHPVLKDNTHNVNFNFWDR